MSHPIIIQGGMGVGVSSWPLARAVAQAGQLGVVSGALLAVVFARRLQSGDAGGHLRRALAHFPLPDVADRVLKDYYAPVDRPTGAPYKLSAMPALPLEPALVDLIVAAHFAEVYLAKEGHDGLVGLNLLEKVQLTTLPSLFGAMLAGADYVLMGAGIPRSIPGVLDRFAAGEPAALRIDVEGAAPGEAFTATFSPRAFCGARLPPLRRPHFIAIVASAALAATLARKSTGRVDGFVVEGETAGGHNAPPRGPLQLTAEGEPVYGPRDAPDLDRFRALGVPFWLAGTYARPDRLAHALDLGAAGIQVGTAFAFCEESGIDPALKQGACRLSRSGRGRIFTDPAASPTGFPFKVLQMAGTLSEPDHYAARPRVCDLGYLRQAYRRPDATLGYRCAAEPVDHFVRKGGAATETTGRKCLCNGLLTTAGLAQIRPGGESERPLLTAGNDYSRLARFFKPGRDTYTAADVIRFLLDGPVAARVDAGAGGPPAPRAG